MAAAAHGGSSWRRSGYAHLSWQPRPELVVAPGVRVSDSTLVGGAPAVSPWVTAEWWLGTSWAVSAGAGVSHQFPELMLGPDGAAPAGAPLHPERAVHVDMGLERRLGDGLRLQATVFARDERDVLWWSPASTQWVGGASTPVRVRFGSQSTLRGRARGVELLLERRASTGVSGWVSYAYGTTRYVDAARGETFWGDFDQRHAVTASVRYALSRSTVLAADVRGASNFPIRGYFAPGSDGRLFVSDRRNQARLPAYARLDVRVSRRLAYAGRDVRLFVEVLNVLDRENQGPASGVVSETGEAIGFTGPLLSRVASAGLAVEF